ncbi:MAG: response regulator [Chloroflexi bacterium]|nr:response regulator [Chloroflexota bacterium]
MRIMYVEDNQVNLGLVVRIAKMGNHEVINFPDGSDALKALETEKIDLILMDIELEGELDGIEVVKRLRARGDSRPIVAITAYAMVGDKERILEAGCDDYLPKPLPVAQFLNILSRYDPAKAAAPVAKTAPKAETKPEAKQPEVKSSTDVKPAAEPVSDAKSTVEQKPAPAKTAETKSEKVLKPEKKPEKAPAPVEAKTEAVKSVTDTEAEVVSVTEEKPSPEVAKSEEQVPETPAQETKTAADPERDPEATVPFDPDQLEAEIKAEREATKGKEDSVNDKSAELQAESKSHDKPDKL